MLEEHFLFRVVYGFILYTKKGKKLREKKFLFYSFLNPIYQTLKISNRGL